MKLKNILLTSLLAVTAASVSAQETEKTVEVFNPHWYVQAQGGMQHTLGETSFSKLNSGNAQVAVGYQFSKIFGARLAVNGWQSKGGSEIFDKKYDWKFNYVAPTVDLTMDLTNCFRKFNHKNLLNIGIFVGVGANIAWNNDEATAVRNELKPIFNKLDEAQVMSYEPNWKAARFMGQAGITVDFRLCDNLSAGIEVSANTLSDTYNSKKAGNLDWYFNGLVGLKYKFGKTYKTVTEPINYVEKIVDREVVKEVPVEKIVEVGEKPFRRDIFFLIRGSVISDQEMVKVNEVVSYMNKHPESKVSVTGYADKNTGNPNINVKYAKNRADAVAKALVDKGISASRITVDSKGDTVQPYDKPELNRVSICIAE